MPTKTFRQRGFTLVELLVVIAIIGLLATVGVVSLNRARAKARDAKRLSEVTQISKTLELYFNGKTEFPPGLAAPLTTAMDGGCLSEKKGVEETCTAAASDVILLNPIPAGPQPAAVDYLYRAYTEASVPASGSGSACDNDATEVCQSYGINFNLETSISGLSAGAHCLTNTGYLTTTTPKACPDAT